MDAYESGGRKFAREGLQFGEANQFQVYDREWSAKARHRRSDFADRFCNCEIAELFTQGCSHAVGRKQEGQTEMELQKKFSKQEKEDLDERLRQIETFVI